MSTTAKKPADAKENRLIYRALLKLRQSIERNRTSALKEGNETAVEMANEEIAQIDKALQNFR